MKIALVYDLLYPYSIGGAEYRNFSLAKYLVLQGHEVHMFGVKSWTGSSIKKVSDRFFIHGVSKYKKKYGQQGTRKIFEPIKYSIALFFELMKHKFDLLDVSAFPYFPVFSVKLYSIFKNKPMVVTWHEVWDTYFLRYLGIKGIFGQWIEEWVAKLTKNNVAVSKLTHKKLLKIGCKHSTIIENWIEVEKINEAKPLKEKYDLISIGRHIQHKNFHKLIRIVALLKKQRKKIKVLILGIGPQTHFLLSIRKKLGLEDNIDILDFTQEHAQMYRYLKSSKIFVLLSKLEGFSISAFEAMAAGLPILTINAPKNALKDYVENDKNGYVLEFDNYLIAEKIDYLIRKKLILNKLGKNAINTANKFDISKKAALVEELYNSLIR
jgi:L-malate glycosyltransferase